MKRITIACDAACSAACGGEVLAFNKAQAFKIFMLERPYCKNIEGAKPALTVLSEETTYAYDLSEESIKRQAPDVQTVIRCLQQLNSTNGMLVRVCVDNADISKEQFVHTTVMYAVASIRAVCMTLESGLEKVMVEVPANETTNDSNDGVADNG